MEQNRVEKLDSHVYGELIFDKYVKAIQWKKDSFFQQMLLEKLDVHIGRKKTLNIYLTSYT